MRPRCSCAGGLIRNRERCSGALFPGEPGLTMCGKCRVVGRSLGHIVRPGTPIEAFFACCERSWFWVEETPGEGSNFVEELDSFGGLGGVDSASSGEEAKMGIDLFRGGVGNAPVVVAASA